VRSGPRWLLASRRARESNDQKWTFNEMEPKNAAKKGRLSRSPPRQPRVYTDSLELDR
jgi:hypothetical protein